MPQELTRNTLLFYRDYRAYSGGHQKVFDYYRHTAASGLFAPRITFSPDTLWDASNPWRDIGAEERVAWEPAHHAALFIGGLDWDQVPADPAGPEMTWCSTCATPTPRIRATAFSRAARCASASAPR